MRVGQARKRDANEEAIVKALRQCGAAVIRISERGAPDLLVLFRGDMFLLEVKQFGRKLTPAQKQRDDEGWPLWIARTPDEALKAIGAL